MELLTKLLSMFGCVVLEIESRVDFIQWPSRVASFVQDSAAINVSEKSIIFIRQVGESSIIHKHILPLSTFLWLNSWPHMV
jgi:hypothetical protein